MPEFSFVYLHVGNDADETEGCILLGKTASHEFVGRSTAAYRALYPRVAEAIESSDGATIQVASIAPA